MITQTTAHNTGFLEGADGVIMVQLFPGTNIHVEMSRDAAQHLVHLLRRYNWTLAEPQLYDSRWRRFWRGISELERSMVSMYVQSNNSGQFAGPVRLDDLPEGLAVEPVGHRLASASDQVMLEFANLRKIFTRSIVTPGEIAFRWHEKRGELAAIKRHLRLLTQTATEWLEADGRAVLEQMLLAMLLRCGEDPDAAQRVASQLSLEAQWLIGENSDALCSRMRGTAPADLTHH